MKRSHVVSDNRRLFLNASDRYLQYKNIFNSSSTYFPIFALFTLMFTIDLCFLIRLVRLCKTTGFSSYQVEFGRKAN